MRKGEGKEGKGGREGERDRETERKREGNKSPYNSTS